MQPFKGKTVLVTGAGGSIGSQLCGIICSQDAKRLKLLSLTEGALYNVDRALRRGYEKYRDVQIEPILGNACDEQLLDEIMPGVDLVIHAAAHKHVPICELHPHAAIANNVGSTWALMQAAARAEVGAFCLISTDKAVNAKSVMGATKRLNELMLTDLKPDCSTHCYVVRFGNVMDSAGSVLPLWREQLANGEPITITDERCERFFMSIPDAIDFVAAVVELDPPAGTFVRDMGKPVKLIDLAHQVIAHLGANKAELITIGLRPGEKLTEELHFGGELEATMVDKVYRVRDTSMVALRRTDVELLLELAKLRDAGAVPLLWNLIA